MATVMVRSSNAARAVVLVAEVAGATTSAVPTGVPLTVAVTSTGSGPLLVTVTVPCAVPSAHASWAETATEGDPGTQSTVSTLLARISPPERNSTVTVWSSSPSRGPPGSPLSTTVWLSPGASGPTVSTTTPSTRTSKVAGAVAPASLDNVPSMT